ncbi:MAG TPA: hypothetical protein VFA46_20445 [Actinomycetes bacterium]|nr:hypothetical protein [Actinomycetes bacterium]
MSWLPPHTILPPQGWKIHVSASLRNAEEILGIVKDYCVQQRIAFKFLRNKVLILAFDTKYAPRESSGKFMTLYPVDEAGLRRTLEELDQALGGRQGPYVLTDLRWRSGPLYVRYGGFLERHCKTETGELALAIADPQDRLVPDVKRPVFTMPDWVTPLISSPRNCATGGSP